MKLALYSFVGSAMVLVGVISAYAVAGAKTMSVTELAKVPIPAELSDVGLPAGLHRLRHPGRPLAFPHLGADGPRCRPDRGFDAAGRGGDETGSLWLSPRRHDPVPAWAGSLGFHLSGIGSWRDVLSLLAVIGIVYGALVALVQRDFKFVIGYSSVSHMGFVLLGLLTLSPVGLSGAVLQMFSHGIIASLLFAVVGRMVYDRTHTRELADLQRMNLSTAIPFAAATFTVATVASMGLPGFSGFVAELQVLIGAWGAFPTLAVVSGIGILISVAYALRALQLAFFTNTTLPWAGAGVISSPAHSPSPQPSPLGRGRTVDHAGEGPHHPGRNAPLPGKRVGVRGKESSNGMDTARAADENSPPTLEPISIPERLGAMLLIGASLLVGLYPRLLLDLILQSFALPLFEGLPKGGMP